MPLGYNVINKHHIRLVDPAFNIKMGAGAGTAVALQMLALLFTGKYHLIVDKMNPWTILSETRQQFTVAQGGGTL